jgi:GGDEF domain-containing protein
VSAYVQVQGVAIRVTVSIGGVMALPGENTAQLVTRADQLMYRSKQQGGNQVTLDT